MRRNAFVLFVLFLALSPAGFAQQKSMEAGARKADFYPLEEVHAGQKGVARTVFSGSEPQEFGVEVLGVLPGFPAPRQSVIIARLSGAQVDRTSVFAGMSGSPVYIDGRLVGAVASHFSPKLQAYGLRPVSGIGGASALTPLAKVTDRTLAPGSSISVELVRGDFSVAASGTVTNRDGEHVYAFGHPFLGLGSSDM